MKKFLLLLVAAGLLVACQSKTSSVIQLPVPERPAGQQDMLQFAADPIADVGIGVVGLGMRGSSAVQRLSFVPGCHIAAVCDVEEDRTQNSVDYLAGKGISAQGYSGSEEAYKALCEDPSVNLVYICTDWVHHVPVALYAMEQGKHVAIEVPSAESLEACWDLVNTSERTRRHCMILENCCYDFFELTALTMAQAGVFGEIIHAEGAYNHNLDPFWKEYWNNWRLDFNRTHRGDKLTTLVAMDTKPFNGPKHVEAATGKPCTDFQHGDVTTTLLRTAKGKTILLEHDVMTPRPYSRMYQLVGTDGYAEKYPVQGICLRKEGAQKVDYQNLAGEKTYRGEELQALMAQYNNPILTPELVALAKEVGGHGGMDFLMDYRLIYCLNKGLPLDMDVYDLAEWCCVTELSRISLENGSMPVEVPDFTRGAWDRIQGFSYAF